MVHAAPNPAQEQPSRRTASFMEKAWNRVRKIPGRSSPYRIGDAVVGDDPFNGRREGVVISRNGGSVGVDTAAGVFFYDHRQLKRQD
jgi:hypothetical protein